MQSFNSYILKLSNRKIFFILVLLALVFRIPFTSNYLYHWDSVNFALSLEKYDVRLHQPHPPGYFLYSVLGKMVNALIGDANLAFVCISVIAGAVSVGLILWLGKLIFNRKIGIFAAFLALTSPLVWFYGEVALSYELEFMVVTIVAGLCFLQWQGKFNYWFLSALALGIAGGIRLNDLVFLFPLWLYSVFLLPARKRIASFLILGGVVLVWAIPMIALSGGMSGYWAAFRSTSEGLVSESMLSSIYEVLLNGGRIIIYLGYGILLGVIPLIIVPIIYRNNFKEFIRNKRTLFFTLWILPAFGFYLFIHIRQHGHVFTFLPAVVLLTAWAIDLLNAKFRLFKYENGSIILILFINIGFFLFAPKSLLGSSQLPLQTPSRETISYRDQFLKQRIETIDANFDPATTLILAGGYNFRIPDYYFRDFQLPDLSYTLTEEMVALPEQIISIVFFDEQVSAQFTNQLPNGKSLPLPDGSSLEYLSWDRPQKVWISESAIDFSEPQ